MSCSTQRDNELDHTQPGWPKGIWMSFDFEDSHPVFVACHLKHAWPFAAL